MLIHARFYSLQERLRLDVFFLSLNYLSFNLKFLLQRELYVFRAIHFFSFNFETTMILNCFSSFVFNIMRSVDVILSRVLRIFDIFVMLIFLFKRIRRSLQFEHDRSTCRIVMTLCSHEHELEIISSTQRSFKNKLKSIFSVRSCVNRALCDLCLLLCNNMCFDVIFDASRRRCSSLMSLLHLDFSFFLTLMHINIAMTTIFRRIFVDIDIS